MRITLVTDTFLPEINGVTTVLSNMRRGLLERGHQVQLVAPAYPASGEKAGILRVPSIPCPAYSAVRLSWPWGRGLARAMDGFDPHVVHVATEGPLGGYGRRYALRRRRPLVTSFHTDFPQYAARYLGRWAEGPTRRYLARFHRPAAVTQTPSESSRDSLWNMGITQAVVWGRGVDSRWFTPKRRNEGRRAMMGAEGKLLVLHVGRLAVEKDMKTLIASWRAAHERLKEEVVFVVAGDGPEAPRVRAELGFAKHLGFLGRGTLADLYADADLFVFPSPSETCGLVALEAMASGSPVVCSDAGGARNSVRDGLTGLVVPAGDPEAFADAICGLVADASRRGAMAQAARAFAAGCDWSRELDALEALYQSLAEAPSSGLRGSVTGGAGIAGVGLQVSGA